MLTNMRAEEDDEDEGVALQPVGPDAAAQNGGGGGGGSSSSSSGLPLVAVAVVGCGLRAWRRAVRATRAVKNPPLSGVIRAHRFARIG